MAEIGNVTVKVDAVITDEQYREAMSAVSAANEYIAALEAENAKLRELCKAWHKFSYELFDEFIGEPEMDDEFMELDDRMQELGVEVSE